MDLKKWFGKKPTANMNTDLKDVADEVFRRAQEDMKRQATAREGIVLDSHEALRDAYKRAGIESARLREAVLEEQARRHTAHEIANEFGIAPTYLLHGRSPEEMREIARKIKESERLSMPNQGTWVTESVPFESEWANQFKRSQPKKDEQAEVGTGSVYVVWYLDEMVRIFTTRALADKYVESRAQQEDADRYTITEMVVEDTIVQDAEIRVDQDFEWKTVGDVFNMQIIIHDHARNQKQRDEVIRKLREIPIEQFAP